MATTSPPGCTPKGWHWIEMRQDQLDAWLVAGNSTRRVIRPFIAWLERTGTTGSLHAPWRAPVAIGPPLDDHQRLALLRRVVEDERLDPRDRFAGALVLLFAQPLTHIVALRRSDVLEDPNGVRLRLGRGPIELPEALAQLAVTLRDQPAGRARVAAADSDWLLPGRKHGSHLTDERLRERLHGLGIPSTRPGRHAALLALAQRLPAPILAERLGLHSVRAAEWVRAAGAPYADYVVILTHRPARVRPTTNRQA